MYHKIKVQPITLSVLILLGLSLPARAADPRTPFAWKQPLTGAFTTGAVYRLPVTGDLFAHCTNFPADIRILDAANAAWPFFCWALEDRTEVVPVDAERLNQLTVPGPEGYVRVDLRLASRHGRQRHNRAEINTSGHDYLRRISLLASEDGRQWAQLGEGCLMDCTTPQAMQNRQVCYPAADFPFLQIRIYPNVRDTTERFTVGHITLRREETRTGETVGVPLTPLPVPTAEQTNTAQVLLFDTGFPQMPVEQLMLRAREKQYERSVAVFSRAAPQDPWRYVTGHEIHRLAGHTQDVVRLNQCTDRYLKLLVYHYDDAPLTLEPVTATRTARFLVFEAGAGAQPALYCGAPEVSAPQFDLQRRIAAAAITNAPVITPPAALTANPAYNVWGFGGWGRWLAVAAVGLVSLLVLGIIFNMFKRQIGKPQTPQ